MPFPHARQMADAALSAPCFAVRLSAAFPDAEEAMLALDALLRAAPLDRRCAEIRQEGSHARLVLTVPPETGGRVEGLLADLAGDPWQG